MNKYDLIVLPVTDKSGKLVGRITIDDVVDVMKEEAEKDYQMASGIIKNVDANDNIIRLIKARIPWLIIGLIGGIIGSKIIHIFWNQKTVTTCLYSINSGNGWEHWGAISGNCCSGYCE